LFNSMSMICFLMFSSSILVLSCFFSMFLVFLYSSFSL
jgi:hypothetical protein